MKIKNTTKILKRTYKIKKQICVIVSLFLIVSASTLHSQGEAWNWNFGTNAALNFAGGASPVATVGSAMNTFGGCSSISSPAGALLFYTNGIKAWDANNVQMPNGFGMLADPSSEQGVIIVPRPGNANLYYIFAIGSAMLLPSGSGTLSYSEVDMTLSGGFGDVTAVKNVTVQTNLTQQITAVKHCNGVDFWIICHDVTNNNYYSFLVTATGVNPVPVVSAIGVTFNGLQIGDGRAFQYKSWFGELNFWLPQNCQAETKPRLLPMCCYGLLFSFRYYNLSR